MKVVAKIFSLILITIITVMGGGCGNKTSDIHVHVYEWEVLVQPKCEEKGLMEGKCKCGEKTFLDIEALEHTYQDGKCIICNNDDGHTYVWVITVQPKCEIKGKMTGTCECGSVIETELKALEHNYVNGVCDRCQIVDSMGKIGYSMGDIYQKCLDYGIAQHKQEVDLFLAGLKMTNLYVNGVGHLKAKFITSEGSYYVNLGNIREPLSLEETNQEYISAISITHDMVLTISYTSGLTKRMGYIKAEYRPNDSGLDVIKSINLNTNNHLFLIYTNNIVCPVGKIHTKNEETDTSNTLYDDCGMVVGLLDYTVSYITVESSIANKKITVIGGNAFDKANNATAIFISSSIEVIGFDIFSSESKLKTIRYGGTKEEWKKITILGNNDALENANIIYECES